MAILSYEFRPEHRFNTCVIEPAVIAEHQGFPANLDERKALERTWFKPGGHACPHCTAEALTLAQEHEAASWFYDASNLVEQVQTPGQSLRLEPVLHALQRNGLFAGGEFARKIRTSFVTTTRPSEAAPGGRKACYRHEDDFGKTCRSREDSEHEAVIQRVATQFRKSLLELYPNCDVSFTLNKQLNKDVDLRPDIKFSVKGDAPLMPVNFELVVEVQQSRLNYNTWQNRHSGLKEVSRCAIWVFKKSKSGCSFKPMLTDLVEAGEPCYVYSIDGELGSSDCDLTLTEGIHGYPEFWGVGRATPTGTGNPVCQNPEYRQKQHLKEVLRSRVSPQSKVKFAGLGSLAGILPGLPASPKSPRPVLAVDITPTPEPRCESKVMTHSSSRIASTPGSCSEGTPPGLATELRGEGWFLQGEHWTGIPPWLHH